MNGITSHIIWYADPKEGQHVRSHQSSETQVYTHHNTHHWRKNHQWDSSWNELMWFRWNMCYSEWLRSSEDRQCKQYTQTGIWKGGIKDRNLQTRNHFKQEIATWITSFLPRWSHIDIPFSEKEQSRGFVTQLLPFTVMFKMCFIMLAIMYVQLKTFRKYRYSKQYVRYKTFINLFFLSLFTSYSGGPTGNEMKSLKK